MEQKLKKAQKEAEDLKFALDQSSIVAITDPAGKIFYCNDKFCEISRYPREELLGQNHRILNSKFHPQGFFVDMWKTISAGKVWKGEIKNRAKDGSYYWVFTTIIPFLDDAGKPFQYLAIRTDITEQKMIQGQLEHERAALLNSEKLASLGEVAAGIAHELGNPIAIIRGRMELLEMQLSRSDVTKENILKISRTATELVDRMSSIIRSMRSLSRDGSKDPFQNVNFKRLIKDVLELSSETYKKSGIKIDAENIPQDLEIYCREVQISQVLVNLINNAKDAIELLAEKWIKVEVKANDEHLEIMITDSGRGIDPEIRHRIMEPFFSTKLSTKGSGLGLSICKTIMDSHKGSIQIDSECKNTRFILTLPRHH